MKRRGGRAPALSEGRCAELVGLIGDGQPGMKRAELMEHFGISKESWRLLLRYARDRYLPRFGLAIPRPTHENDYRFKVTSDWTLADPDDPAIKEGHRLQVRDVDTRTQSSIRDAKIAYETHPNKWSREARDIKKRLDLLVGNKAGTELLIELTQRDLAAALGQELGTD